MTTFTRLDDWTSSALLTAATAHLARTKRLLNTSAACIPVRAAEAQTSGAGGPVRSSIHGTETD